MPSGSSSSSEPRLRLWLERGASGYWLRDAATGEAVRWDDGRLRVVKLAGASYRVEALQDDAFSPGRRLALVRAEMVPRFINPERADMNEPFERRYCTHFIEEKTQVVDIDSLIYGERSPVAHMRRRMDHKANTFCRLCKACSIA